jgi:hypothetical protein
MSSPHTTRMFGCLPSATPIASSVHSETRPVSLAAARASAHHPTTVIFPKQAPARTAESSPAASDHGRAPAFHASGCDRARRPARTKPLLLSPDRGSRRVRDCDRSDPCDWALRVPRSRQRRAAAFALGASASWAEEQTTATDETRACRRVPVARSLFVFEGQPPLQPGRLPQPDCLDPSGLLCRPRHRVHNEPWGTSTRTSA